MHHYKSVLLNLHTWKRETGREKSKTGGFLGTKVEREGDERGISEVCEGERIGESGNIQRVLSYPGYAVTHQRRRGID